MYARRLRSSTQYPQGIQANSQSGSSVSKPNTSASPLSSDAIDYRHAEHRAGRTELSADRRNFTEPQRLSHTTFLSNRREYQAWINGEGDSVPQYKLTPDQLHDILSYVPMEPFPQSLTEASDLMEDDGPLFQHPSQSAPRRAEMTDKQLQQLMALPQLSKSRDASKGFHHPGMMPQSFENRSRTESSQANVGFLEINLPFRILRPQTDTKIVRPAFKSVKTYIESIRATEGLETFIHLLQHHLKYRLDIRDFEQWMRSLDKSDNRFFPAKSFPTRAFTSACKAAITEAIEDGASADSFSHIPLERYGLQRHLNQQLRSKAASEAHKRIKLVVKDRTDLDNMPGKSVPSKTDTQRRPGRILPNLPTKLNVVAPGGESPITCPQISMGQKALSAIPTGFGENSQQPANVDRGTKRTRRLSRKTPQSSEEVTALGRRRLLEVSSGLTLWGSMVAQALDNELDGSDEDEEMPLRKRLKACKATSSQQDEQWASSQVPVFENGTGFFDLLEGETTIAQRLALGKRCNKECHEQGVKQHLRTICKDGKKRIGGGSIEDDAATVGDRNYHRVNQIDPSNLTQQLWDQRKEGWFESKFDSARFVKKNGKGKTPEQASWENTKFVSAVGRWSNQNFYRCQVEAVPMRQGTLDKKYTLAEQSVLITLWKIGCRDQILFQAWTKLEQLGLDGLTPRGQGSLTSHANRAIKSVQANNKAVFDQITSQHTQDALKARLQQITDVLPELDNKTISEALKESNSRPSRKGTRNKSKRKSTARKSAAIVEDDEEGPVLDKPGDESNGNWMSEYVFTGSTVAKFPGK